MGPPIEAHIENFRRLEEQIRNARRHIEFGRTLIEQYKCLLETYRAESRDTSTVEHFIEAFEGSQKVFEWDLAELERRRESTS
jgi:hypothetical protein